MLCDFASQASVGGSVEFKLRLFVTRGGCEKLPCQCVYRRLCAETLLCRQMRWSASAVGQRKYLCINKAGICVCDVSGRRLVWCIVFL